MESVKSYLLAFGIPGLFLVSFLDSAGVPLPGGVDLVVMVLSWQRPELFFVVALVAAGGSLAGCLVLYRLARIGGDAMMARLPREKQEWVREKVRRNDVLAIVVAMLDPPPFPTKPFIIAAGAVQMDWRRLSVAVFAGRLVRFLGEAFLAARIGDRAAEVLKGYYPAIGIVLVLTVIAFLVVRRRLSRPATAP